MGFFNFLKKDNKEFDDNSKITNSTSTINVEQQISILNSDPFDHIHDKYTRPQVTALFLRSMSYKPHKIGKCNDDYPRYLQYEYNILDVPTFHKNLVNKGYFTIASFKNVISNYKVTDLKEILVSKNLIVKGLKKDALIELAITSIDTTEQENISKQSELYELSNKGLDYLEEYKDFFEIIEFKKYDISYALFMKYKKQLPDNLHSRDIAWRILNDRLNYYIIHNMYGSLRNHYLNTAQFLDEETHYTDVLYYYILCLYCDINFANIQESMLNKHLKSEIIIEWLDDKTVAPGIVKKIKDYAKYHNDSIFQKKFSRNVLPYKFINDIDFKKMIHEIYETDYFDDSQYVMNAISSAKKTIRSRSI